MHDDAGRAKQLGRLGEREFDRLCILDNLSRSRPDPDEQGWDFLVEMPANRIPGIYLDAQPAAIKFLCQVKATDDFGSRKLAMKVSNFEHLARTPLPSFVFVVDYRGANTPHSTYLCPFDDERIAQTLRRIRELEAAGRKDLHRHEMTFTVRESEAVAFDGPGRLSSEVIKHTGISLAAYAARKGGLFDTLGYEDGRTVFRFGTEVEASSLVDAFLGLGELEIKGATLASTRFGIDMMQKKFVSGVLRIEPTSAGTCRIVATRRKTRGRVEVAGEVFVPPLPDLALEHLKVRVTSPLLQLVVTSADCNVRFDLDPDGLYGLDDLIAGLELMETCGASDARIALVKDHRTFVTLDALSDLRLEPVYGVLLWRLRLLRRFLDAARLRQDARLRPRDVLEQGRALQVMDLALARVRRTVTSKLCGEGWAEPVSGGKGIFSTPVDMRLGDLRLVAFCHWDARFTVEPPSIAAEVANGEVWAAAFSDPDDIDLPRTLQEEHRTLLSGMAKGPVMVRVFEFADAVGDGAAASDEAATSRTPSARPPSVPE